MPSVPRSGPGSGSVAWTVMLGALAIGVHLPALRAGFVYDDPGYVVDNPLLRSWSALPGVFVVSSHHHLGFAGHYRPVTSVSWAWDILLSGGGEPLPAWPLHATNLAIHGLVCAVLYQLLARHLGHVLALPASLLYATHPVHVEVAAWIAARSESLAMLLAMLTLLALRIQRGAIRLLLVAGVSLLAYGAKETAFLLPAAVAALCVLGRWPGRRPWDGVAVTVTTLAAFLAIRTVLLEAEPPIAYLFPGLSWVGRCRLALSVIAIYGRLLLLPWPLTVEHYWPGELPAAGLWVAGAAVLCGVGALLALRRTRGIGLAWVAVLVLLAPFLHLNHLAETVAERFLYMASAPFCVFLALLLQELRRLSANVATAGLVGLAVLWGSMSLAQSTVWQDELTLWTHAVKHAPDSPVARDSLAHAYQRARRLDLALEQWEILWRSGHASDATRHNLAVAYHRAGRYADALDVLGPDRGFRPGSDQRRLQEELRRRVPRGAPAAPP